jgi:phosphoesterase RecJ-like protein
MSFRSVGNFPVNLFAQKHFSGGGHKNAAGSDYAGSPQDTEKKLLDLLPLYQTQLDEADK